LATYFHRITLYFSLKVSLQERDGIYWQLKQQWHAEQAVCGYNDRYAHRFRQLGILLGEESARDGNAPLDAVCALSQR